MAFERDMMKLEVHSYDLLGRIVNVREVAMLIH